MKISFFLKRKNANEKKEVGVVVSVVDAQIYIGYVEPSQHFSHLLG